MRDTFVNITFRPEFFYCNCYSELMDFPGVAPLPESEMDRSLPIICLEEVLDESEEILLEIGVDWNAESSYGSVAVNIFWCL